MLTLHVKESKQKPEMYFRFEWVIKQQQTKLWGGENDII